MIHHSRGADFVETLRTRDARLVPHGLPRSQRALAALLPRDSLLAPAALDDRVPYYAEYAQGAAASPDLATFADFLQGAPSDPPESSRAA